MVPFRSMIHVMEVLFIKFWSIIDLISIQFQQLVNFFYYLFSVFSIIITSLLCMWLLPIDPPRCRSLASLTFTFILCTINTLILIINIFFNLPSIVFGPGVIFYTTFTHYLIRFWFQNWSQKSCQKKQFWVQNSTFLKPR